MAFNLFNSLPADKVKRNNFSLSHTFRCSVKLGRIYPVLCLPIMPNDTVSLKSDVVIRLAPQLAPVMAHFNVYCHYFFVPWRIIWDDYGKFFTQLYNEDGSEPASWPRFRFKAGNHDPLNGVAGRSLLGVGSLCDFLGYPLPWSDEWKSVKLTNSADPIDLRGAIASDYELSALPLRAYQMIFNEYYRDQNVSNEVEFSKGSGIIDVFGDDGVMTEEFANLAQIRLRAWAKDYFTSALPEPQRGPDVPLFDNAGLSPEDLKIQFKNGNYSFAKSPGGGSNASNGNVTVFDGALFVDKDSSKGVQIDNSNSLEIVAKDGSGNSDAPIPTINELRRRVSLQRFLEISNRAGNRLKEFIFGHFGSVIPDDRLQRPEYLGGGIQKVTFTDVIQNSASVSDDNTGFDRTALGQQAGYGICVGNTGKIRKHFYEHGYVMCLMSIRPKAEYFQGIDRHLQKFDLFDHAFREFANLGEQEIYEKELFFCPGAFQNTRDDVFGYTPRYAEYKFMNNSVHGEFRTSLNYWHAARTFGNPPNLNQQFIQVSPEADNRLFAVSDQLADHYYCSIFHDLLVKRALPKYGVPKLI